MDRLLQSISIQTFTDYEIVITDDSPDQSLLGVIQKYGQLPIVYYKNEKALGTPANWNHAISLAKGIWIKIMHDDDWFASESALQHFADATSTGKRFIVSRYQRVWEEGRTEKPDFPGPWKQKIIDEPMNLLATNVIGPPSVTMVHRQVAEQYDTFMKWRVDIDLYVRVLMKERAFELIDQTLVNVGFSESQVTNSCINLPEVELPEGLLLLHKYGTRPMTNVLVYDAWWRILRNVGIRNTGQLKAYTPHKKWPDLIFRMVRDQSVIPSPLLRFGPVSKLTMMISYLFNKKYFS